MEIRDVELFTDGLPEGIPPTVEDEESFRAVGRGMPLELDPGNEGRGCRGLGLPRSLSLTLLISPVGRGTPDIPNPVTSLPSGNPVELKEPLGDLGPPTACPGLRRPDPFRFADPPLSLAKLGRGDVPLPRAGGTVEAETERDFVSENSTAALGVRR